MTSHGQDKQLGMSDAVPREEYEPSISSPAIDTEFHRQCIIEELNPDIVDETQHISLEQETQARDSLCTSVEESQQVDLELDSQAPRDELQEPESPTHHNALSAHIYKGKPLHTRPQLLFSREPDVLPLGVVNNGFKFEKRTDAPLKAQDFTHGPRPSKKRADHEIPNQYGLQDPTGFIAQQYDHVKAVVDKALVKSVEDAGNPSALASAAVQIPHVAAGAQICTSLHQHSIYKERSMDTRITDTPSRAFPVDNLQQTPSRLSTPPTRCLSHENAVGSFQLPFGIASNAADVLPDSLQHDERPASALRSSDLEQQETRVAEPQSTNLTLMPSTNMTTHAKTVRSTATISLSRRRRQAKHNIKRQLYLVAQNSQVIANREFSPRTDSSLHSLPIMARENALIVSRPVENCPFPEQAFKTLSNNISSSKDIRSHSSDLATATSHAQLGLLPTRNSNSIEEGTTGADKLSSSEFPEEVNQQKITPLSAALADETSCEILSANPQGGPSIGLNLINRQENTVTIVPVSDEQDDCAQGAQAHFFSQMETQDHSVNDCSSQNNVSMSPTRLAAEVKSLASACCESKRTQESSIIQKQALSIYSPGEDPHGNLVAVDEHASHIESVSSESPRSRSSASPKCSKATNRPMRAHSLKPEDDRQIPKISGSKIEKSDKISSSPKIKATELACEAGLRALLNPFFEKELLQPALAIKDEEIAGLERDKSKLENCISRLEYGYDRLVGKSNTVKEKEKTYVFNFNNLTNTQKYLRASLHKINQEIAPLKQIKHVEGRAAALLKEARTSINELETKVQSLTTSQNLLTENIASLEKSLNEERLITKMATTELERTNATYVKIDEVLKNIPNTFAEELKKKDGILDQMRELNIAMQSKYENMIELMTGITDITKEFSPTLNKSFEDFMTSLEKRIPEKSVESEVSVAMNLLNQLKEHFDQKFLQQASHQALTEQISALQNSNSGLQKDKLLQESNSKELLKRFDFQNSELENLRLELAEKNGQLITLQSQPGEEAQLREEIAGFECENERLHQELHKMTNISTERLTEINDLKLHHQDVLNVCGNNLLEAHAVEKKEWEGKLNSLREANKEEQNATTVIIRKLKSENENLQQKRQQLEQKFTAANDETKKTQEELVRLGSSLKKAHGHIREKDAYLREVELQTRREDFLEQLCHEAEQTSNQCIALRANNDALEQQCQQLKADLEQLTMKNSMQKSNSIPRDTIMVNLQKEKLQNPGNHSSRAAQQNRNPRSTNAESAVQQPGKHVTSPTPEEFSSELSETFTDAEDLADVTTADDARVEVRYRQRLERRSQSSISTNVHSTSTQSSRLTFSKQTTIKNIKTPDSTPISHREESRRRREARPAKSALKKTVESNLSTPLLNTTKPYHESSLPAANLAFYREDKSHQCDSDFSKSPSFVSNAVQGMRHQHAPSTYSVSRHTFANPSVGRSGNNKRSSQDETFSASKRIRSSRNRVIPDSQEPLPLN